MTFPVGFRAALVAALTLFAALSLGTPVSATSVTTTYTYDALGRVITSTTGNGATGYTVTYSYDASGNRTAVSIVYGYIWGQSTTVWGSFKWGSTS